MPVPTGWETRCRSDAERFWKDYLVGEEGDSEELSLQPGSVVSRALVHAMLGHAPHPERARLFQGTGVARQAVAGAPSGGSAPAAPPIAAGAAAAAAGGGGVGGGVGGADLYFNDGYLNHLLLNDGNPDMYKYTPPMPMGAGAAGAGAAGAAAGGGGGGGVGQQEGATDEQLAAIYGQGGLYSYEPAAPVGTPSGAAAAGAAGGAPYTPAAQAAPAPSAPAAAAAPDVTAAAPAAAAAPSGVPEPGAQAKRAIRLADRGSAAVGAAADEDNGSGWFDGAGSTASFDGEAGSGCLMDARYVRKPTSCSFCGKIIWGLTKRQQSALRCWREGCKTVIHSHCKEGWEADRLCGGPREVVEASRKATIADLRAEHRAAKKAAAGPTTSATAAPDAGGAAGAASTPADAPTTATDYAAAAAAAASAAAPAPDEVESLYAHTPPQATAPAEVEVEEATGEPIPQKYLPLQPRLALLLVHAAMALRSVAELGAGRDKERSAAAQESSANAVISERDAERGTVTVAHVQLVLELCGPLEPAMADRLLGLLRMPGFLGFGSLDALGTRFATQPDLTFCLRLSTTARGALTFTIKDNQDLKHRRTFWALAARDPYGEAKPTFVLHCHTEGGVAGFYAGNEVRYSGLTDGDFIDGVKTCLHDFAAGNQLDPLPFCPYANFERAIQADMETARKEGTTETTPFRGYTSKPVS